MKKLNIIALALATCTMTFGASAAIGSGQSQPFDPNEPSIRVGATEGTGGGHGGAAGDPGIGVQSVYGGKIISFSGLTKMAPKQPGMKHMWSLCLIALVHMTKWAYLTLQK